MPDQLLDRILEEIRQRMNSSRAAYEESQRLEAALAALGPSAGGGAPPARARRARRRPARESRPRAPRGENLRRIREQVEQRPGATAGEIAAATGIARATVAGTLGKLARDGTLAKTELPSGRVGYRFAATASPVEAAPEPAPEAPAAAPEVTDATPEAKPRPRPRPKRTTKPKPKPPTRSKRKAAATPAPLAKPNGKAPAAAPDEAAAGDTVPEPDAS